MTMSVGQLVMQTERQGAMLDKGRDPYCCAHPHVQGPQPQDTRLASEVVSGPPHIRQLPERTQTLVSSHCWHVLIPQTCLGSSRHRGILPALILMHT